ncbi:MAG: hypothetical protein ABIQ03_11675 [Burkholderiales bacterium]
MRQTDANLGYCEKPFAALKGKLASAAKVLLDVVLFDVRPKDHGKLAEWQPRDRVDIRYPADPFKR